MGFVEIHEYFLVQLTKMGRKGLGLAQVWHEYWLFVLNLTWNLLVYVI